MALAITTSALPNGVWGAAYSATPAATGGMAPYSWDVLGALPAGLAINASTGVISGTPSGSGTTNLILRVTDSLGGTASVPFSIEVAPSSFAKFQQGVADRIQDAAGKLSQDSADGCIREAITGRYSAARPIVKITDLDGDGSTRKWTVNVTNFPGWAQGCSVISGIEYPADMPGADQEPQMLDRDEWLLYWPSSAAPEIRLKTATPMTGEKVRVTYSAPHSADGSDVPDTDFHGAVNLAAALAARRLYASYNQLGDAAFGADAVNYHDKARECAQIAKTLEQEFERAFGMDKTEEQPAASSIAQWKDENDWSGGGLTH